MQDEKPPGWKQHAESFRLWFPLLISICAISLTVFQAMHTRRHTKLSVQPRLELRVSLDSDTGVFALSLANVGFGPGILSKVAFAIDDDIVPATSLEACQDVARRLGRDPDAEWDVNCFASDREFVLRAGETVPLLVSEPTEAHAGDDHSAELVDYNRISATATYCSFYEECWTLDP